MIWTFNYCEERTWEKAEGGLLLLLGSSKNIPSPLSLQFVWLSSPVLSPFLLLSDFYSQPMHGSPGKPLSVQQTLELKASLTSSLWQREVEQCTKHSKWKTEMGHCVLAISKLSKQSQIFILDILAVLFSCGECFRCRVGCSNAGCSGCCAGFQLRAPASVGWAMPHPGVLYGVVCVWMWFLPTSPLPSRGGSKLCNPRPDICSALNLAYTSPREAEQLLLPKAAIFISSRENPVDGCMWILSHQLDHSALKRNSNIFG